MVQRLHAHPYLSLFNGADPSLSTAMRDSSTLPLQGLFLFNNQLVHQQAAGLASRLADAESDPVSRLERAYLMVFARPASPDEKRRGLAFLEQYEQVLELEGVAADARQQEAWSALARILVASNELMYVD
jgi:hypothetical protein